MPFAWYMAPSAASSRLAYSPGKPLRSSSATPTEIDIYAPSRADGSYTAGDPIDQYFISAGGGISPGTQTFPIQNRQQTPPNETSIGVRILWTYTPPAGIFPTNMRLIDYAVMKAAPLLI